MAPHSISYYFKMTFENILTINGVINGHLVDLKIPKYCLAGSYLLSLAKQKNAKTEVKFSKLVIIAQVAL